jgi:hypothetical protein
MEQMHRNMAANRAAIMSALAQKMGITTDELAKELRSGKTLHRVGTEHNVSDQDMKQAINGVVQPKLAASVQSGDLSQKQADAITTRIQNADLDLAHPWLMGGADGGHMGHGKWGHHGGMGQSEEQPQSGNEQSGGANSGQSSSGTSDGQH